MAHLHEALDRRSVALLLVDVQEKLMAICDPHRTLSERILLFLKGCHLLQIPCIISEQYPKGLGTTVEPIKKLASAPFEKSTFSCLQDPSLAQAILAMPVDTWIVVGIEAHVCVLQTVRDLLHANKKVVVPIDAISSRTSIDRRTAIGEMRTMGVRITTCETLLFELLKDSCDPLFKPISQLIK